jgi:hypothetical protein
MQHPCEAEGIGPEASSVDLLSPKAKRNTLGLRFSGFDSESGAAYMSTGTP